MLGWRALAFQYETSRLLSATDEARQAAFTYLPRRPSRERRRAVGALTTSRGATAGLLTRAAVGRAAETFTYRASSGSAPRCRRRWTARRVEGSRLAPQQIAKLLIHLWVTMANSSGEKTIREIGGEIWFESQKIEGASEQWELLGKFVEVTMAVLARYEGGRILNDRDLPVAPLPVVRVGRDDAND